MSIEAMNKRIKELAEQAGLEELWDGDWCSLNHPDVKAEHLERFAELIRQDLYQVIGKSVIEQINSAVQIEREECAKLCESMARPIDDISMSTTAQWIANSCAAAIRARGNT